MTNEPANLPDDVHLGEPFHEPFTHCLLVVEILVMSSCP
jgi:hypothetical protein